MENNKKKKYQYYKNNYRDNNRKYYYKKKKKSNKENNLNVINDSNNKKELYIDEDIDYNEYEGMLKKKKVHKDINLDDILVRSKSKENNKVTHNSLVNIDEKEESKEKGSLIIGTKFGYVLGVLIVVFALFGSTYAFFNYYKEDTRQADIVAGEAYVRVVENNLSLSLTNQYPRTNEEARRRTDNYIDFNLVGKNTSLTKVLGYKFTLSHGTTDNNRTRISDDYILFDLAELDGSNNETLLLSGVSLSDFNSANISGFYVPTNQTVQLERHYRIRAWISEEVTISDNPEENAIYTQAQYANLYANFTMHVSSQDRVLNIGSEAVMKAVNNKIDNNVCNPIWVDDNGTANDETDDITYFSGTNDCVDMNYVWYSGKLWRITAIYPDGAMKMVTENNITTIAFNELRPVNFYTDANTTSYMYQWLNEEFYSTLYNANEFIDTTKRWNATSSNASSSSDISNTLSETTMISSNVGLINSYEFYCSYRNLENSSDSYLVTGYYWMLLNPYNEYRIWIISEKGLIQNYYPARPYGTRPAVYLKPGVEFEGNGTSISPFRIVGDKASGSVNQGINTRLSGEYVKLKNGNNEQLFRIIGIEDNKTKIIAMDYADNKARRKFATSDGAANALWGSGTTTGENTWYTYLNATTTGYFDTLKNTYGELFDSGLYYLGTAGFNYKLSVCVNTTSGNTKVCNKTTQTLPNSTDTSPVYIGLPRYGEMFAAQQSGGFSNSIDMWLMNPYDTTLVWAVYKNGYAYNGDSPTDNNGVRPTVYLKPTVIIKSGSGTQDDPYVVGL